ncbi:MULTISPECIES: methyltransferase domain-containing protein, partial [unclassified Frankia]|uniref:methyltransferase domain-containing protein n=1 Tax=unclassified Frankia TaxID=2632575 RepID=UPI002AD4439B
AGMNVLEIGTGTGYNAALLAERSGPGHVVTMEVDPTIADHARTALTKTGYSIIVITADGALGHPDRAPYDRVIATAATPKVPYSWVEQTRPAGRIVAPLLGTFQYGALACLTVHDDGTADGRFHGEASFMPLRARRPQPVPWPLTEDHARTSTTTLYPHEPFNQFDAAVAIGSILPECTTGHTRRDNIESLRLFHADTQSWAALTPATHNSAHYTIAQYGPRRLWDELEAAYHWWIDAGRPDHTRVGITVTPEEQTFWLDTPQHPLPSMKRRAV